MGTHVGVAHIALIFVHLLKNPISCRQLACGADWDDQRQILRIFRYQASNPRGARRPAHGRDRGPRCDI